MPIQRVCTDRLNLNRRKIVEYNLDFRILYVVFVDIESECFSIFIDDKPLLIVDVGNDLTARCETVLLVSPVLPAYSAVDQIYRWFASFSCRLDLSEVLFEIELYSKALLSTYEEKSVFEYLNKIEQGWVAI